MTTMNWRQLLSARRLGQTASDKAAADRSAFQRDYDRIVFSSAFRRLQGKTQVIPIPETDFVHTRLTHSLEVSCVGRSLGKIIGDRIMGLDPDSFAGLDISGHDFGAVVAAACLAHDLGNPPFGHSGEDAISDYFRQGEGHLLIHELNDAQKADLQYYEGNASGFRLLTHTYPGLSDEAGGLGLTYATLGAFTKYPKGSLPRHKPAPASRKKYGLFQSELDTFRQVAETIGLPEAEGISTQEHPVWHRHPLAFVMEAADDICYRIIDLEDGYRLGLVSYEEIKNLLFFDKLDAKDKARFEGIKHQDEKIGYLRAKAIGRLIGEAADEFTANYEDIMNVRYDRALIDNVPSKPELNEIKKISISKIYECQPVLEIEAAGFEVLGGLLDAFLMAALRETTGHHRKTLQLMPSWYRETDTDTPDNRYLQILNVAEFISSMTDAAAISLFRKIKGIALPRV